MRLPFERRRFGVEARSDFCPLAVHQSYVASSLGDGGCCFIEAQKAALKGTPDDPDVLAGKDEGS